MPSEPRDLKPRGSLPVQTRQTTTAYPKLETADNDSLCKPPAPGSHAPQSATSSTHVVTFTRWRSRHQRETGAFFQHSVTAVARCFRIGRHRLGAAGPPRRFVRVARRWQIRPALAAPGSRAPAVVGPAAPSSILLLARQAAHRHLVKLLGAVGRCFVRSLAEAAGPARGPSRSAVSVRGGFSVPSPPSCVRSPPPSVGARLLGRGGVLSVSVCLVVSVCCCCSGLPGPGPLAARAIRLANSRRSGIARLAVT